MAQEKIKFWSEKVFGVPVDAVITRRWKDGTLSVKANYFGAKWSERIHPGRIVEPLKDV
jgi:hypothetical protein